MNLWLLKSLYLHLIDSPPLKIRHISSYIPNQIKYEKIEYLKT